MAMNYDSLKEGDRLPELKKEPITQVQLVRYAGAAGDFNPIHTVPQYAREAGLDGTIAHGMLVMGMLGQLVSDWAGVENVVKFGVSFKSMTKPGDVLTASGEIKRKYEKDGVKFADCAIQIADEKGELKIEGKATVRF
jgi:acyl dehydratase